MVILMLIMRTIMIVALASLDFTGCCAIADAATSSARWVVKGDAATVYSKADRQSRSVKILTSSDTFYLQLELFNGSDRWCAVGDREGAFVGYVLCDQIHGKTESEKGRKRRIAGRTPKKTIETVYGAVPDERPKAVPADRVVVKQATAAAIVDIGNTSGDNAGNARNIAIAVFAGAFWAMTLCGYWLFKNTNKNKSNDNGGPSEKVGESKMGSEGANKAATIAVASAAVSMAEGADNDAKSASSETGNEHVRYKVWDCVIVKADESCINELAKCQLCGTVQRLTAEMKCSCCDSSLAYYVEVEE